MPEPKRPLKVFLCHASTDKPKVRELYRYLKRRGIQPWFDEEDLVGGQDWQIEIPKALATSDAIIICLTKNSVDKEGYIQKEIKFALDKALEMPEGRIFLIPVKFEECEVPFTLSRYQWVDLTVESGYAKMMKALKFRASQLERSTVELSKKTVEEEKLVLEKAAEEKTERAAVEMVTREKKEQAATEKTRLEAEELARQKTVKEKAKREATEKAAPDKTRLETEEKVTTHANLGKKDNVDYPQIKDTKQSQENNEVAYLTIRRFYERDFDGKEYVRKMNFSIRNLSIKKEVFVDRLEGESQKINLQPGLYIIEPKNDYHFSNDSTAQFRFDIDEHGGVLNIIVGYAASSLGRWFHELNNPAGYYTHRLKLRYEYAPNKKT